jgi:hypothetical protein
MAARGSGGCERAGPFRRRKSSRLTFSLVGARGAGLANRRNMRTAGGGLGGRMRRLPCKGAKAEAAIGWRVR